MPVVPAASEPIPPSPRSPARRRLLNTAAGTLALGAPLVRAAPAAVTLRFHTFMNAQSAVWKNMHMAWMDAIERDSQGGIRFERHAGMTMGGTPAQLIEQARDGVADVVWTQPGYTPGRFPRTEVFELPFVAGAAEPASRALWQWITGPAQEEWKDWQLLAANVHGPGVFHSRSKAIRRVEDLRGMKVRGPSRPVIRLLAALGAAPVGMPLPQIPDALSKGVVDAVVLPWEVTPSVKVEEMTREHTEFEPAAGALYTLPFVLVMNPAKYRSMPTELRAVIDRHSGLETSAWLGRTHQSGDAPARRLAEARGNRVTTLTVAEAQAFRQASDRVDDEWIAMMRGRGLDGQALLEAAKALIRRGRGE